MSRAARAEKKHPARKQGQSVFQNFCAEDLVAAAGGHEQHIALLGIQIPVEDQQAVDADKGDPYGGGKDKAENAPADPVVPGGENAEKEKSLHNT